MCRRQQARGVSSCLPVMQQAVCPFLTLHTARRQLVRRMQRVALSAGAELPPPLRCDEGRVIVLLTGTVHVHSGAAGAAASGESGAVDGEESEDQGLRDPQSSGVSSVSGSGINFGGGTAVEPPAPCASALAPDLAAGGSAPAAVGACAIVNAARDSEPVVCTGPCLLGKAAAEASAAPEGGVTGPAGAVAEPPVVCVVAATAAECWLLGASAMQQVLAAVQTALQISACWPVVTAVAGAWHGTLPAPQVLSVHTCTPGRGWQHIKQCYGGRHE